MSTNTESESCIDRRTFMKGISVTGAAAVGVGLPRGPVGEVEALPPLVIAGAYAAGTAASGVSVGWALREFEIVGADSPPEGLTGEALSQEVAQTARTRKSTNASTIVDNQNIGEGIKHTAYTDGKIAAIEKLNEEVSQEEVQDAALSTVYEYEETVLRNLFETWNESVLELDTMGELLDNHPDVSIDSVFDAELEVGKSGSSTYEFSNGNEMEVHRAIYVDQRNGTAEAVFNPFFVSYGGSWDGKTYFEVNGSHIYLSRDVWSSILDSLESVFSEVSDGLQNWVVNVYSEVQSGSIDVEELLTPREQAELLSDDEEYPQAVADLIALNIPVDPNREATIAFDERDITISGLMAPTSPPENGFQTGESYDPEAADWDLYFTYDPSLGSGGWAEVEPTISEGELVFTDEPYAETLYRVPTTQGVTVEVVADDFTESDGGGTWIVDVSDQIERTAEEWTDFETGIDGGTITFTALPDVAADFEIVTNQGDTETVSASDFDGDGPYTVETGLGIAEIDEVTAHVDRATIAEGEDVGIYSEDGESEYETVQIREPFTIESIEDSDGNEVGESDFSRTEPQNDENYITQDEWDELQDQNQELIDKYEEAASNDDSLFGGSGFDGFGDIPVPGGATAAAVGVGVVVLVLGVLRQIASFYLPGR